MNRPIYLLNAVTSDTNGDPVNLTGDSAMIIEGTLGGGTVALQVRHADDAGEWRNARDDNGDEYLITNKTSTPVTIRGFSALQYRATLTGSTAPNCTVKLI